MTTPTPAPAPMTARLRELMEKATPIDEKHVLIRYDHGGGRLYRKKFDSGRDLIADFYGDEGGNRELLYALWLNAPTILRLLEAVEGAETALEYYAANCADMPPWRVTDTAGGFIADWEGFTERARSALATLRAAREVKP